MGKPRMEDTKAACNRIKSNRRYSRKALKGKSLCIPIKIDDTKLICKTTLLHNIFTGTDTIGSHAIKCKSANIYPTTHQKLKCTNKHAIDALNKYRKFHRKQK